MMKSQNNDEKSRYRQINTATSTPERDRYTDRQRQVDKQTCTQAGRQAGRQTDIKMMKSK